MMTQGCLITIIDWFLQSIQILIPQLLSVAVRAAELWSFSQDQMFGQP